MPSAAESKIISSASAAKKVAIYARCSTHRDQNPQLQIEELRRYCQARGWEVAAEIADQGYSGTSADRPGLKKLLGLTRSRQVDLVAVLKLDRLFRSLKHMVITLQEFSDLGIEFVSVKDQLDLTTAAGRLMVHLVAAFAEFERELIVERTLLGIEYARSCGAILGRPKVRDDSAIIALRNQGLSYREIQNQMGCSSGAINRAISLASKSPAVEKEKSTLETRCKSE